MCEHCTDMEKELKLLDAELVRLEEAERTGAALVLQLAAKADPAMWDELMDDGLQRLLASA